MKFKPFLARWQKVIQFVFTIGCLIGAGIVLDVAHILFQERIRLFWIFTSYIIVLTCVGIFFGRRLIAMICDG
ncbi:MAG: hypothetical protein HY201_01905 [Nitrospirae bacterium]|nr:hypothetical protein [Candidatus Troglogloeales bacterium]MBI3598197.1 hypothetical protein [Candidatus Troglogloeales bacterium]